jgi:hypothetical protein
VIELYAVPAGEDDAFLAAYRADAPPGHTLYRALRADAPHRFVSVPGPPRDGALLIVEVDDPHAWEAATAAFRGRQGFLGAEVDHSIGVAHWSSPLMYARTVNALGDLLGTGRKALYGRL